MNGESMSLSGQATTSCRPSSIRALAGAEIAFCHQEFRLKQVKIVASTAIALGLNLKLRLAPELPEFLKLRVFPARWDGLHEAGIRECKAVANNCL